MSPPIPTVVAEQSLNSDVIVNFPAEFDLESGDCVLLYSDGVTDAMSERNERFGRERLESALKDVGALTAQQAIDALLARLNQHRGETDANDDITIVVVKVAD